MILVTGGTGLIGSHLIYNLLKAGNSVRATRRSSSDLTALDKVLGYYALDPELLKEKLEWVECDLLDINSLDDAMEGVTQLYHCAAIVSFEPKQAQAMLDGNPETTANVVNAALAHSVKKMVYVSSVAALGRSGEHQYITEDTEWTDSKYNSNYARSKYRAELEVWRGIQEGLDAAIVNPVVVLGPGNWTTGSAAIFHTIAKGFSYFTLGTNGFVDVRDVVKVMEQLMESDISGERFVLVSENLSYKMLFQWIAEAMNVKVPHRKVSPFLSSVLWRLEAIRTKLTGSKPFITKETAMTSQRTHYYDNSRVKEKLGFEFRNVKDTVKDLSRLYRQDHY